MAEDITKELAERAAQRFGEARAAELSEDLARLAAEITAVRQYPIAIDDEP
jgi:hypothetical protein